MVPARGPQAALFSQLGWSREAGLGTLGGWGGGFLWWASPGKWATISNPGFQVTRSWARQVVGLGATSNPGFQVTGSWAKQVEASLGKRAATSNPGFQATGRWARQVLRYLAWRPAIPEPNAV